MLNYASKSVENVRLDNVCGIPKEAASCPLIDPFPFVEWPLELSALLHAEIGQIVVGKKQTPIDVKSLPISHSRYPAANDGKTVVSSARVVKVRSEVMQHHE
jgi:hypothetical protein